MLIPMAYVLLPSMIQSSQIVAVYAPAYIDSRHAAEGAQYVCSHKSNFGPDPPANPPEYYDTDNNAELLHVLLM